jgi:hypothetical protein
MLPNVHIEGSEVADDATDLPDSVANEPTPPGLRTGSKV